MGAIVDIIHLDRSDISLLKEQYPDCVLTNLTKTNLRIQQYRLIIPDVEQYDDSYYNFGSSAESVGKKAVADV